MAKIYVITNPMPTHNNSPAVSLGKFIRVVEAAGFEPTVMGARMPEQIPGAPESVHVRSFRYGGRGALKMLSFLLLQIKSFFWCVAKLRKNDPVYFWIADKMLGAFLAAKLRGAEAGYFLYGKVFADGDGGLSEKLVRFMMNRATCVCAESPAVFDQWNVPADKRRQSIRLFVPESETKPIPFDDRSHTVSMYCRLSIGKHIEDSVRAFVHVHKAMPEYRLQIVGGGVLEEETRELIKELSADYVTLTGWLEHSEALKCVADSRVLLYPTDAEGVPGGILEAMSLGIPALASPVGGIPDVIEDGVDGAFLTATDPETIARELTALLQSDSLSAMSCAARQTIEEKFTLDSAAANFKAVRESHQER